MTEQKKVKIGVIGLGHWGPNHVRVFGQCKNAQLVSAADPSEERRRYAGSLFHDLEILSDPMKMLRSKGLDAVVIATPTTTHLELARAAMESGKHVLLEKPMCMTVAEAQDLAEVQAKTRKILMIGHVFLYNRGIAYIKEEIQRGSFGRLQYLDAARTNLGPIRSDINVVQDLAVHELSIFDYLFNGLPRWVSASGQCLIGTPREDVAFLSLEYPNGLLAHVHVSWLHPQKIRNITLVGDKNMVVWNDTDASEPVKVYNKGLAEEPYYDSFGHFQLLLRDKEVVSPKILMEEPLKLQAEAFIKHILEGSPVVSGVEMGLRTIQCLEAVQQSLRNEGKRIYL